MHDSRTSHARGCRIWSYRDQGPRRPNSSQAANVRGHRHHRVEQPRRLQGGHHQPGGVSSQACRPCGRYLIRTEATVALDGTPPKRFVLLAFDSKEKAEAWYAAPDIKEINAIRDKTTTSNVFIVEGFAN